MNKMNENGQLCWECTKATNGGCSWSKHLQPVEGWTAILTHLSAYDSYKITDCPEFEYDGGPCKRCIHNEFEVVDRYFHLRCPWFSGVGKGDCYGFVARGV